MSIISKEAGVKLPEDIKRVYGFDPHSLAALGAKHPEDPQENLEFKKRLYYLLMAPVLELADERLKNLRQAKIDLKQGVTHAELSQELWDAEGHEHRLPSMDLLEKWSEQVEKIDKVTAAENDQGIDVEKKRHLLMDRKTHLWKQGLIYESRKMVDDYIWQEHREKFERFVEGGLSYADIRKELEHEFLAVYERESPMQGFLLGVGENEDLEKIYWGRRKWVNEARDAMAQMIKRGEKEEIGSHFSNLEEHDQEKVMAKLSAKEEYGKTDDLMRAIRKVYKLEGDNMAKGIARESDLLFTREKYDELFNDSSEYYLKNEDYREQLDVRAKEMFTEKFTDLSGDEQRMVMVGTGEVLSHTEIMRWMVDYRTGESEQYAIRISEETDYRAWIHKGLVKRQGLWLLADMQNAYINSFGARPEIRALDGKQVDSQRMQGMGRYRLFDVRSWEVFYGPRGWVLEPENENKKDGFNGYKKAMKAGALQILLKGLENEAKWAGGLWQEWKEASKVDYKNHLKAIKKAGKQAGREFQEPEFEDYIWSKMKEGGFGPWAQEMYASGWKLLAEKVFMQLRGEWIVQKAMLGLEVDKLVEALSGDKMGMKIGPYGEKVLSDLYMRESKGIVPSILELLNMEWSLVRNVFRGKLNSRKLSEFNRQKITEQRNKAAYRLFRETALAISIKPHKFLGGRSGVDLLAYWSLIQLGLNIAPNLPYISLIFRTPMYTTFWGVISGVAVPWLRLATSLALLSAKAPIYKQVILSKSNAADAALADKEERAEKYLYALADGQLRGLIKGAYTEGFPPPMERRALNIISKYDK